jgi:undecaprenyl-diphosphatase
MAYFFDILKTILFGIVEGITEWLPISSTGHLLILESMVGEIISHDFMEMFDVVIQLGAILAVVVIYFNKLNPFSSKKTAIEKQNTINLWIKVIVACLPAAVIGLLLDDWLDAHLFKTSVVAVTLILYGIAFIVVEERHRGKKFKYKDLNTLPLSVAIGIGMFQVLALVPGTSRSGATILGGMILGASRYVSAEFTFFLAIPVMFGASLLKLVKFGLAFSFGEFFALILGMVVSFVVSILAIKFLMNYIKKHNFKVFGIYRIILGIVILVFFAIFGK